MMCYTLGISIALIAHSLDLRWSAEIGKHHDSIDISQDLLSRSLSSRLIRWSETIL